MSSHYRARLWLGIGTSVLIGSSPAAAGTAPTPEAVLRPARAPSAAERLPLPHRWEPGARWDHLLAKSEAHGGEGGEGGEGGLCDLGRGKGPGAAKRGDAKRDGGEGGEGGEGGGKGPGGFAQGERERLLVCLAMMEGHLRSGLALYQSGEQALASTHFAHPAAEVWEGIEHAIELYDAPEVEEELDALHRLALGGAPAPQVAARQAQVLAVLNRAGDAVSDERATAGVALRVALTVLQQAAHEYEEAVEDGKLGNPIEYQDARGFVQAAHEIVGRAAATMRRQDAEGYERLKAVLDELADAVRDVNPQQPRVDSHAFSSLVARAELAAGGFAKLYGAR